MNLRKRSGLSVLALTIGSFAWAGEEKAIPLEQIPAEHRKIAQDLFPEATYSETAGNGPCDFRLSPADERLNGLLAEVPVGTLVALVHPRLSRFGSGGRRNDDLVSRLPSLRSGDLVLISLCKAMTIRQVAQLIGVSDMRIWRTLDHYVDQACARE